MTPPWPPRAPLVGVLPDDAAAAPATVRPLPRHHAPDDAPLVVLMQGLSWYDAHELAIDLSSKSVEPRTVIRCDHVVHGPPFGTRDLPSD